MSNRWTDDVVTRGVTRISHNFEITEPDGEQEMIRLLLKPTHSFSLFCDMHFNSLYLRAFSGALIFALKRSLKTNIRW